MTTPLLSDKVEVFFTQFNSFHFQKGASLIAANDVPKTIYFLKEGNVKQYVISNDGDELLLNIYKPHAFFPLMMELGRVSTTYYFEAMSEIKGWAAPKEKVVEFIVNNPEIVFDLLQRVYKGVDGLLLRMQYLMSGNAHTKLISILLISAKRFGKVESNGTQIKLRFTEKDLAAQAGISRETVSRQLQILKKKKLIEIKNKVLVVPDVSKLEEALLSG
jgi:CRP/FNR family transcriptional regulator